MDRSQADKTQKTAAFEVDLAGMVVEWTDDCVELFGFSPAEMIGNAAPRIAIDGTVAASFDPTAYDASSATFGWAHRKDGSRFWAGEATLPIRGAYGQLLFFERIVRELTYVSSPAVERDRFFQLSADIMCVAGFDGYFKLISPAATKILGYEPADLVGRRYLDFVHPDDLPDTQAEAETLAVGDQPVTRLFRNRYRHADGSFRWLQWHSNTVLDEQLIYAVARDVTEQTADAEQAEIHAVELERSNAELQQFAYVASHDLQEPLRAVAGCVQMLRERNTGLDERSLELIEHAVDGAQRLQVLINDLLSLSRVGSKGINKVSVNSQTAAEKAVRQLQAAISEADAAITIEALPVILGDEVQITQLFQNLIGNAIKFRVSDRRPEIRVSARHEHGSTVFSVCDNGIGIPPEYHERVFGVFQRLNSRRSYTGTGIGLAICKKIVDRHNGRISIEAAPRGNGTNFQFTVPDGIIQP